MELSLTKLFGGSRYLIQSIHAKKLQVRIFSRLGWISPLLLDDFLQKQTMEWSKDVKALAEIAKFEPQASYAAFIYGTSKRWTFVSRTTPNISENMKKLDWMIQETFLPAILGKDHVTDEMKKIAALQPKRGGLGIGGVSKACDLEYLNSKLMTQNLAEQYTYIQSRFKSQSIRRIGQRQRNQ